MFRQLLLLRHAKSSWENPLLDDHDRPLNDRGRRVAAAMGKHLTQLQLEPELVVSSPALRAWQTALLLSSGFDKAVDIHLCDPLYHCDAAEWWNQIKALPDEHSRVLLVGHNPELHQFVAELSDFLIPKFPTCALALFEVESAHWQEVKRADIHLKEVIIPKKIGL